MTDDRSPPLERAVFDTIREPLLVLDTSLCVILANAAYLRTFSVTAGDTEHHFIYSIGNGQWAIPALRELLDEIVPRHTSIESFEIEQTFPRIGHRVMLLNARQVVDTHNGHSRLLIAIEDITERRKLEREKDELLYQKELLLAEMTHRVNNSLSIVASILLMKAQSVQSEETRSHLRDAHGRIMAVARVQGQLRPAAYGDSVGIESYLKKLCESLTAAMILDGQPVTIRVASCEGTLTSQVAVSLGLIATELIINSLKHAFPTGAPGEIVVAYETTPVAWRLTISDNGVGANGESALVDAPKTGLGTSILEALCRQLGGRMASTFLSPGLAVSVTAPVRTGTR